ncbi:ABC transporter permease subunit [Heliobacterium gestii]|uniref:ABC transporter permease subunit n=2 Tax=Heliomicrobium gestii TaxID=2699 RepID=A0A845LJV3_HELGE|nr:ABC transporter permease subunit [Heliomicrobium gestii]
MNRNTDRLPSTSPPSALRRGGLWLPLLPFFLFVIAFELLPFLRMACLSIESPRGYSLIHYVELFQQKFFLIALGNSISLSLACSVIGLLIGMIGAHALTLLGEDGRDRLLVLINSTSNFAGVPLAFAYIVLLGTNGLLTLGLNALGFPLYDHFSLYSWSGLMLVYVYFQAPLAILLLYPAFAGLRDDWRDAVHSLGGSARHYWLYVGLPNILPSLAGAFSILFANAMGAYATAYALTSGNYSLAPLRIGNLIAGNVELNPNLAAAIAVTIGALLIAAMAVNHWTAHWVQRRMQHGGK